MNVERVEVVKLRKLVLKLFDALQDSTELEDDWLLEDLEGDLREERTMTDEPLMFDLLKQIVTSARTGKANPIPAEKPPKESSESP